MNDLLINNISVLLAVCGAILLLTLIQLFLAINQDKRETNAGPIKELEELKVEIERKEAQKLEIEGEVEKFRKTIAEQAELMAQADYLQKRIEELQIEWGSLDGKRAELNEFLTESERAQVKRSEIETSLQSAKAELDLIQDRLLRKEELENIIEELQKSKQEFEIQLKKLRDEVSDLSKLIDDEERLKREVSRLESKLSELSGLKEAKEIEFAEASAKVVEISKRNVEISADREELLSTYNAEVVALNSAKKRNEQLNAEAEVLTALIKQKRGELSGGNTTDPERDPLEELKVTPPVIRELLKLSDPENITEIEALAKVKERFNALNLKYHDRVLNSFHTSMKTNETTQMAVLAGISGTGKSQLPRQYALGMGIGFLQIPVQPRWDSPQDLMGFYNYIEGKFKPTDMARALWSMDLENNEEAISDRMLLIMLDEMNLARVEYYFSDFLSRLESRPSRSRVQDDNERKDAEIELEIPGEDDQSVRLFPGYNLLFAGTMNEDETTQSLSDKVVDRANVLRFGAPESLINIQEEGTTPPVHALSRERWQTWVRDTSVLQADTALVDRSITQFSNIMKEFNKPFGHRLAGAMKSYVANYPQTEGIDRIRVALADQIEMRLLPKLRGVDVGDYATQFSELQTYVQNELNDTTLSTAIEASVEQAQNTRQFTWIGVTR